MVTVSPELSEGGKSNICSYGHDFQQPPHENLYLNGGFFCLAFSFLIATYYLYNTLYTITSDSYPDQHFQSYRDVNRVYEVQNSK